MLSLTKLRAGYGDGVVLKDIDLQLNQAEILCLLGRNGAGKTTLLKSLMNLIPNRSGVIELNGVDISKQPPHRIASFGIGYVPQGRRLFAELSVMNNLEIGMGARPQGLKSLDSIFELFPVLQERLSQQAGTLSGGEQQMLAMARALCIDPDILLLDEPTEGLMPSMISAIRDVIVRLKDKGVSIILVEQRVDAMLSIADRVAFMENGKLPRVLDSVELNDQMDMIHRYVGISDSPA
ncbi:MAG: branched-chain amino acid transport system ATP-binding protein [Gammaproteobacteria bacterium]|jgi:branched-chain amino acid transport system ATP-binding protein